ncbi:RDD family protein [Lentzea fradiae]|uniref:RDD family protein n=1 Tax=Lentzea fradiae TaxID=200378 RepID=A0A1G7NIJ0_9PSEU|nr:RDD family protein [Lentzea fradiae]SDF73853.1 RDD family protein [Lentzea fradiae]
MSRVALDAEARSIVLRRYSQHVIELVLLVAVSLLSLVPGFFLAAGLVRLGVPSEHFALLAVLPMAVVPLLAVAWAEIWYPYRHGGSTPAMRWLGIRITTLRGGEPSLRDYFVRWLLMVVDGLLFGLVGAVLIAVTPRNQRFGDIVTGTVVVRRVT